MADYQVLRPLGEAGDASRALLARAPARLDAARPEVALHLIDGRPVAFAAAVDHLRAVAAAGADGLCEVLEAGRSEAADEFLAYVAVRYCPGGSLADPSGIEAPDVLRAMAGAARGAHHLHEAGIAHGRIRPSAVLRYDGGGVLTPPLPPGGLEPGQTADADPPTALDTIEPALLRGEAPSRASDLWALAATAHRVLCGRCVHPLLESDDPLTGVQRVLFERPLVDENLHPQHAAAIAQCLRADPSERPSSAAHLADTFEALAGAQL